MEEFIANVSPKGQITLPMEIGKQLSIKPKDKVALMLDDDGVKVTPAVG
ncbi:MAG: AbrB/MazE/SpoVT family DNA-binding domain-containing protein [Chloroflexota bacterium]|nr:AbrB/MazE/SpoVT family DNA-binding domain-containing protein [Chloroflexota bacterium]